MPLRDIVNNPHDGFFQAVLGHKETAGNFFENYLPAAVLKVLDVKTLQIKKNSFIEKELKRFYSDILYQVASKNGKAYIYLLFEHQSSPDSFISFRFLRYIVKIWELELKQRPKIKLLPPIIPLILYHGKRKWDSGTRLSDIIALGDKEELKLYVPDYHYILYDLSAYSDEQIQGNIMIKIFLDLFKHIFDEDLLSHLKRIFPMMKALSLNDRSGLEYIELVLRYIMSTRGDATPEKLKKIVEETISKNRGGIIMTVAEQLIEKGEKKGREEGMEKGIEKGELIGDIRIAQLKKGMLISDKKELETLSLEELHTKLEEMESLG